MLGPARRLVCGISQLGDVACEIEGEGVLQTIRFRCEARTEASVDVVGAQD